MADYIDRDALLEKRWDVPFETEDARFVQVVDVKDIMAAPAADVAPVRRGRWVEYENESDMGYHYCSECKHQAFNYDEGGCNVEILSDYCHNCGARMDGGDKNDE